ncbi:MAG: hypothetical protein ABI376_07240 [Caulobacteraceae bacterium]
MSGSRTVAPWLLAAALCVHAAPATAAPANLAPNTQWEIFSGVSYSARWNIEGSAPMRAIAVTGNSTELNAVTFFVSGSTGELKVGDLIAVSGAGVDPVLTRCPMRVVALTPGRSVTVDAPLGLAPSRSTPSRMLPVNIGGEASTRTGDAADRWSKTFTLPVWREDNPVNLAPGAWYALAAHKDLDEAETISLPLDVTRFRGRTVAFGVNVLQRGPRGAATWRVFFRGGGPGGSVSFSPAAVAGDGYEWREIAFAVPMNATTLTAGISLEGPRGATYYIANPVLTPGRTIGADNYVKPQETFVPIVHVSPWINASLNFQATGDPVSSPYRMFDLYAESGGQIAPTVRLAEGAIEGIDANPVLTGAARNRAISFTNSPTAPNLFSPILGQYAANVKSFGPLSLPLDDRGRAWFTSGVVGDTWYNVSIDLCVFLLQ